MNDLWAWSRDCFGYRQDNIGVIYDHDEVSDHKGHYLGKTLQVWLIRNQQKNVFVNIFLFVLAQGYLRLLNHISERTITNGGLRHG
ncbi:TPA: hypothetical protein I8Z88_000043 [Legionella pneumophila]|nr:hypothetical protein [Legionella pneumophila]